MSAEKTRRLKPSGAEVVAAPVSAEVNSPERHSGVAARQVNEISAAWQPNAFANLDNPECRSRVTGPEIWRQTDDWLPPLIKEGLAEVPGDRRPPHPPSVRGQA